MQHGRTIHLLKRQRQPLSIFDFINPLTVHLALFLYVLWSFLSS